MDLGLPEEHPARDACRAFLAEHERPTGRQLAEAGYVVPHWPPPYGLGADPVAQLVIDDELRRAGVRRPLNPIGIGWAGPTILHAGTEAQQERWLWPLLAGEEFWCQLFSEPGAGSDLAALSTRAVADGDHFVVSGQKVWTSYAHWAAYGILLARTDPDAPKHLGITYFVCPMDLPGITVRPLVDMTGEHAFNEVFFDEVRLPADHVVGRVNGGWELAKVTLGNERVSLSGEGVLWGRGPTADDLVALVRAAGGAPDPVLRDRLATVFCESEILRVLRLRTVSAVVAGRAPGPEASVRKALADAHGQHVMDLGRDLAGPHGMVAGTGPTPGAPVAGGWPPSTWSEGFLYAPALTIGGGTAEVQRNIVAERVLGLPRDLAG
ncbi:MAG TPA: acyl-CoA dehydrogenase family protein [Acidimicrobiales bacterium]|nr:acyl-CoA dehydrogenase family protein [Acidimicrobiales bacterium]